MRWEFGSSCVSSPQSFPFGRIAREDLLCFIPWISADFFTRENGYTWYDDFLGDCSIDFSFSTFSFFFPYLLLLNFSTLSLYFCFNFPLRESLYTIRLSWRLYYWLVCPFFPYDLISFYWISPHFLSFFSYLLLLNFSLSLYLFFNFPLFLAFSLYALA
jgi:hypothetical protein